MIEVRTEASSVLVSKRIKLKTEQHPTRRDVPGRTLVYIVNRAIA